MEAALAELVELDGTKTLAIKRALLAQVWRQPQRQVNLARLGRQMDTYGLTDSRTVGRRLADSDTADVVDAHLAVIAERH